MKRYKFQKKIINIKNESLDRMIEACVALPQLTRASVSDYANVSLVTAGKILTAMDECRFTKTVYKYPENGRPYKLHVINEDLTTAILDLSSADLSMSIIRGGGNTFFYKKYGYSPDASLRDSIRAVLTRACLDARSLDIGVSALCVILADNDDGAVDLFNSHGAPTLSDKNEISSVIASVFGTVPLIQMSFSEALSEAVRFNRLPELKSKNTAYIYVGCDIKICYLPQGGDPINCRPKDLLLTDDSTLSDALERVASPLEMAKILARAVNFAYCAFNARGYVIEYDTMKFGSRALGEIKRSFAILPRELPEIVVRDHRSGAHLSGAAAAAACSFIKLHISSSEKQKTSEDA